MDTATAPGMGQKSWISERRLVVCCPKCHLTQFWSEGKTNCIRPGCSYQCAYSLTPDLTLVIDDPKHAPKAIKPFDNKGLGKRVAKLRQLRGLTQRGLGKLTGQAGTYLSKLEQGRTTALPATMERVADALGVTMAQLLDPTMDLGHLASKTEAELAEHERFMEEIAAIVPTLDPQYMPLISTAARHMAAGQYTLPDWMHV